MTPVVGTELIPQSFVKGLEDITKYDNDVILRAIRYGCERVDLESGGTITSIIAEKPSLLTKEQEITVQEAVA